MFAGVCAGVARRWGLDVTLVRIVAVVLTLLSGVGVAAYVAAWLLTPSVDAPAPLASDSEWARRLGHRSEGLMRRLPRAVLLIAGVVLLVALVHSWWFGIPVGAVVFVGVLVLIFGTKLGRWAIGIAALIVALLATFVGVAGPHLGSRTYTIASTSDLRSAYNYGAGTVKLNLASISNVNGEHKTEVHLGRGAVVVTVPQGVPVLVHARAGLGSVKVDGHRVSGIDAEQTVPIGDGVPTATNRIVIDITVGAGSVTVR
jgi:phage shock protein PspC (stress-responsive transcriptional regulator)